MSDEVGNPEDRFSHNEVQLLEGLSWFHGILTLPQPSAVIQNIWLHILASLRENLSSGFQTRFDTNLEVQQQKMARDCTIYVAKTKVLISCVVTSKRICDFVFTCKSRLSHDPAHVMSCCMITVWASYS